MEELIVIETKEELLKLNKDRMNAIGCDCTITVEFDVQLKAHKRVLAQYIPYFSHMFNSSFTECKLNKLHIKDLPWSILDTILTSVYTDVTNIEDSNVHALFFWSNYLQVNKIEEASALYIQDHLTLDNVFDDCRSHLIDHKILLYIHVCKQFICKHFKALSKSRSFIQLHESVVVTILSWSTLNVTSEKEVFETACSWVNYDPFNRGLQMFELIEYIRLPLLPLDYINLVVRQFPACKDCSLCCETIAKAVAYHETLPEQRASDAYHVEFLRPRHYVPVTRTRIAPFKRRNPNVQAHSEPAKKPKAADPLPVEPTLPAFLLLENEMRR